MTVLDTSVIRASQNFIFGYGSLICHESRIKTAPTLRNVTAIPVTVQNIQRVWAARIYTPSHHLLGWTAVGVTLQEGKSCNGVLVPVDEEELQRFDIREKNYDRVNIDWKYISKFHPNDSHGYEFIPTQDSSVWVYTQKQTLPANKDYPITQSYVDVIFRGCLSISDEFCKSFVETTDGWWHDNVDMFNYNMIATSTTEDQPSEEKKCDPQEIIDSDDHLRRYSDEKDTHYHHTWVDDRYTPAYKRTDAEWGQRHGHIVDELLKNHTPHAFGKRKKFEILT